MLEVARELRPLIEDMKHVLNEYRLVGIAAPQIGISVRIFLMQFKAELMEHYPPAIYRAREMETLPLTVIISIANRDHLSCHSITDRMLNIHHADRHKSRNQSNELWSEDFPRGLCEHLWLQWRCGPLLRDHIEWLQREWGPLREAAEGMERENSTTWNGSFEWAIVHRHNGSEDLRVQLMGGCQFLQWTIEYSILSPENCSQELNHFRQRIEMAVRIRKNVLWVRNARGIQITFNNTQFDLLGRIMD